MLFFRVTSLYASADSKCKLLKRAKEKRKSTFGDIRFQAITKEKLTGVVSTVGWDYSCPCLDFSVSAGQVMVKTFCHLNCSEATSGANLLNKATFFLSHDHS